MCSTFLTTVCLGYGCCRSASINRCDQGWLYPTEDLDERRVIGRCDPIPSQTLACCVARSKMHSGDHRPQAPRLFAVEGGTGNCRVAGVLLASVCTQTSRHIEVHVGSWGVA